MRETKSGLDRKRAESHSLDQILRFLQLKAASNCALASKYALNTVLPGYPKR